MKKLHSLKLSSIVLLVSSVHDSIVVDAPAQYLPVVAKLFHESFASIIFNIKAIWGYTWQVPLTCEIKYGPNMKDMQKYDLP